jgi:hypothetical protein
MPDKACRHITTRVVERGREPRSSDGALCYRNIREPNIAVARGPEPRKLGISHRLWSRRAKGGPIHIHGAFEFSGALRAFRRLGKGNPINSRFLWRRVPRKGRLRLRFHGFAELVLADFGQSPYGRHTEDLRTVPHASKRLAIGRSLWAGASASR